MHSLLCIHSLLPENGSYVLDDELNGGKVGNKERMISTDRKTSRKGPIRDAIPISTVILLRCM